ncbi:contractile injection system protein, VgrG/Pvc8 family [Bartonella sp. HY329]|uniref:phage late control D family protein n=1 Tax=unclassified Bartonella TaxID=2645622 RepID=UPI0021CA40F5|nr:MULTISPECIES: contractile injection system protein, VgrG/Pvc8 family [unclassified Bartonella]UXM94331.1 contractile injection system protein, VgrG/Pvc8 family [Bartonella sp. HY329]UXN08654.1 contractile injection system protein, VgrG/Pvc8 family [Bartonella sp. HY328]
MSEAKTPHAVIKVNGKTIADGFNGRLISVQISDKRGITSDTITLELRDGDPFLAIPEKSDIIEAWLGYLETGVAYFGKYTIDDPEIKMKPYTLSINGKGADMRDGLKAQKGRHFDNKSIHEIVSEIAGEHGLSPMVDPEVGSYVYKWVGQQDESDIHFIERLAKRHGAIFTVKDGKMIFAKKGSEKSASGKKLMAFTATPQNTIEGSARVVFSHRSKFKSVKAHKQNRETAERDLFSEESDVDGTADYEIAEPFGDEEEAKIAAKAKGEELKSKTITTSCQIVGDPRVRAGSPFTYQDMRPQIDGIAFNIETATHAISKSGYTTSIDADLNPQKDNEAKKQKKKKARKAKKGKGETPMRDLDWSDLDNKV